MKVIYKITNLINDKVYIGQTIHIDKRKKGHFKGLKENNHINKHLQNAWNKYGEQNFRFDVIEEYPDTYDNNKLTEREQYWIDYYGGINSPNVYNVRDAGDSGTFSNDIKLKISSNLKGHEVSSETRKKLSIAGTGRHHTEETKRKIGRQVSISSKGKIVIITEKTKRKISKTLKGRPAHNKGIPMKESTKQKISQSMKGKKPHEWTKESRLKLSKSLKGKPAWNKGIPSPYKGSKLSKERKQKLREIQTKLKGYAVDQYTLDNKFINTFCSTMEAERQTGIKNSNIGACCRGLQHTAGGYIWKKHILI